MHAGTINRLSKLLFAVGFCAGLFVAGQAALAEEVIRDFNSMVYVTKDGDLDVEETITMDFGADRRHGLLRWIPVQYDTQRGKYKTPTRVKDVTVDGARAQHWETHDFNNLQVKIGDPDRLITGVHVYKLHYIVSRAINFFDKQPEIYWNATGNESPFRIERARAEFVLPAGVSVTGVRAKAFRGAQGSHELADFSKGTTQIDFETNNLAPREGLTFVLRLPPGSVTVSSNSELMWWLMDWWPALFTPWLALLLVLTNWWVNGRDPANAYVAGVDWNPPKELSPAEVGTLVDEQCDVADIVSTLVDLASRGYLKIKQLKTQVFFFSNTDYEFTKLDPPADAVPLRAHERVFLAALFNIDPVVRLSDLKNKFYIHIPTMKEQIYGRLTDEKYFIQNPEGCRSFYQTVGTVIAAVGLLFIFVSPAWAVGLGVSGLIVLIASPVMPARTHKGVEATRQAIGFKRFVQKAEKERIRVLAKEDPTIFGRLLPYAMVLGAADQWANSFHDLLIQPPDWYEPYDWNSPNFRFSSTDFVNDLGDGMRTCATTFTSNYVPPTSGDYGAASGSSGFDIGGAISGGFSGGGFGGGGTGSW